MLNALLRSQTAAQLLQRVMATTLTSAGLTSRSWGVTLTAFAFLPETSHLCCRLWDHVANNQLACWHVPTSRTAQGHAAAAAAAPAADCEGGAAAAGTSASPQNGQAPPVNGANPSPKLTESAAGQAEGAPSKTPRTPAEAAASHRAGDSSAAPDVVSAAAVTGAAVAAAAIHGAPDPAATEEADAAASQGAAQAPKHDAAAASDEKAGQYVAHEGGGVAPGTGDAAQTAGDQPTVLALAVLPSG